MTGRYQISLREGGDECEVIIITGIVITNMSKSSVKLTKKKEEL